MFCRYCGKPIESDDVRCKYCGKHQWESENAPEIKSAPTGSGFMQAPSLEDDLPTSDNRTVVEPVAVEPPVRKAQSDSVYPPRANPMQQANDLDAPEVPYTPQPQRNPMPETTVYRQQEKPVTPPQQEVMGYRAPVTPPEKIETESEPIPEKKKKRGKGGKVFGIILFLIIVLAAGWYFSGHGRFDLSWEQSERKAENIVESKLGADIAETLDEVYIVTDDVSSRYYTLDSFENVGSAELICHFENQKLSGAELYSENGDALVDYICGLFDIDSAVVETQAQMEYNGTYVVIRREGDGARAMFADTTYGGVCSIALEPYFGI